MISLDTRLQGSVLCLRGSMIKFPGTGADIEICGSATRPLSMYLNRQYIKIMEDHGVSSDIFLELQAEAVETLRRTTRNGINAALFLSRNSVAKAAFFPWLVRELYNLSFSVLDDNFVREILELAVLVELRELKYRARILVENGVTLYGIMDETNTLGEGEIYCCTDKYILQGPVTIGRAPALHPGDMQVVMATDVPATSPLKELHNCIVFSQQGLRDLPSQLSGGDLDGDLYSVIYDPRLQLKKTYQAAEYPRVPPVEIKRAVNRKDITDFFIQFMENDQLGRIANLHL